MRLSGGLVFDEKLGFVPGELCTDGQLIAEKTGDDTVVNVSDCYLIPGLTDLHFHGCMGEDFSDGSKAGLHKMASYELSRGVTQICPAGMTLLPEQLKKICEVAAEFKAAASHIFLSCSGKSVIPAGQIWVTPRESS